MKYMTFILEMIKVIADVAVIIGVIVAIQQLKLHRRVAEMDNERRKKESTLSFANEIISQTNMIMKTVRENFGKDTVNISDERFLEDKKMQGDITEFLNLMERMSVGINTGVYDFDIFNRICGTRTLRAWDDLKNVVNYKRDIHRNQSAYTEFEEVAERIRETKRSENPISNKGSINSVL